MPPTPRLDQVLDDAIAARLESVHTAFPAEVTSFDRETSTIGAQALIDLVYRDETGEKKTLKTPVIPAVPVVFPGCGKFRFEFPLVKGDTVLIVVCSSSIQNWKLGQGRKPRFTHHHNPVDAVAVPGLFPMVGKGGANGGPKYVPHGELASIGLDGADASSLARIWFHPANHLRLGGIGADDRVARKSDLTDLKNALTAVGTAGGPSGAVATAILAQLPDDWPVCSAEVRVP